MSKSTIFDWDSSPANNSDISGINVAEGCPASGINDAIRTLMAHVASWLNGPNAPLPKSGGALTGAITSLGTASTITDGNGIQRTIGYRSLPLSIKSGAYTLALADVGQGVAASANITIPTNANAAFAIGDAIAIYNASASNITITQATGVTLRLAGGSNTGNRTLAQRGLATILKVNTDEWLASGMGVS